MLTKQKADRGKRLFGTSIMMFGQGLIWFHASQPGGIFTLRPLNFFDALFRAEIVIGAMLAAYGVLEWRSASRKLSFANYIIVLCGACVLVLYTSKFSEWVYFSKQQRGYSFGVYLEVSVIEIAMVTCIVVFGGWWADSTFMRQRFDQYIESHRFLR
jgi:hypothetical protein